MFFEAKNYKKLAGDIDLATDVPTFERIALQKSNGSTKLEKFQNEGKIQDVKFTAIDHGVKDGIEYGNMSINWEKGTATLTRKN
ncbi:MAG: hypothetical protein LBI53_06295 [Candidatus Peribacteria bacterium]|jgi:hypothetical protein|nr:hypothetical protein [Candidatus Peribacteria bacterium]